MNKKLRMVVVSAIMPYPGHSGQQQRVAYKLRAFQDKFDVTFLTFTPPAKVQETGRRLAEHCDAAIVLPSRYWESQPRRLYYRAMGSLQMLHRSLKFSNYLVGCLELSAERISHALGKAHFDIALYEYWHAAESTNVFRNAGIPCVLDMHDLLWKSYERQLAAKAWLPGWWQERAVSMYRNTEEMAWTKFDALITINALEHEYVRDRVTDMPLFYAPMGIDLKLWPYSWKPSTPPRIAYYGGLSSQHNQRDALRCLREILPAIWTERPEVEFWIVGSNPPDEIRALAQKDQRVQVTGFVEEVQHVLSTMSIVLCPWKGRYGFRSRLIEVMALGVPVAATADAVYGMDLKQGKGLFLASSDEDFSHIVLSLLNNELTAREQSLLASAQVHELYGYDRTYGRLASQIADFVRQCKDRRAGTSDFTISSIVK